MNNISWLLIWILFSSLAIWLGKSKENKKLDYEDIIICILFPPFAFIIYLFKDSPYDTPHYIYKPSEYNKDYERQLERYNNYWKNQPWYASKPVFIILKVFTSLFILIVITVFILNKSRII